MSIESPIDSVRNPAEESASSLANETKLGEELALVKDHVSQGRLREARTLVNELASNWPSSPQVQYWTRVLAPPIVRRVTEADPRSRPFDREREWLHEHAREYPGQWLAVYEDRLIAANPDLGVVLAEKRGTPEGQRALLHFQPNTPTSK
jgi:hypothetical protein